MFRFEDSFILWFTAALPLCLAFVYLYLKWRQRQLSASGDISLINKLIPEWSKRKLWIKNILFLLAVAFLFVAWSNPQWGMRKEKVKVNSSDVIIALDISQSMMAEDISPNRMERAKFFVSELVNKLKGDRIGLIFFAGSAYLQMPLTSDYASAKTFVQSASPTQAGTQGTVIADAIKLAEKTFGDEAKGQKAMIIISDGENHESAAVAAAREAREKGIFVFTLGIGTTEGAMIPVVANGRRVMKTDKSGNAVVSRLNSDNLVNIAEAGGGSFYMIDPAMTALSRLDDTLERLEKREVEQRSFTDYNSYFQIFLALSLILLIVEFLIGNKSSDKSIFKKVLDI